MREKLKKLNPLHSCPQCEGYAPLAAASMAQCERAQAAERWRKKSRRELARNRMRVSDREFDALVTDYGRLSQRLAANGDTVGADWPARVGLLADVVLDARSRVEMVEFVSASNGK